MTDTLKILGQLTPAANNLEDLYTVPSSTQTSVSSVIVCNQSGANIQFSISVAVNGAGNSAKQYLYFNIFLDANDSFVATLGLSLSAGDVVRVKTDTETVSFNMFGVEVS